MYKPRGNTVQCTYKSRGYTVQRSEKMKRFEMRMDDEFVKEIEYLRKIYGFRSVSEVIRWVVNVAYRKEQ